MGHGLDAPLLQGQEPEASAPPLYPPPPQVQGAPYQLPVAGAQPSAPHLPPQQQQQQHAVGVPAHPQQQQQQPPYPPPVLHPSVLPALRPPAVHVVEQHTYLHLPEEPLITRSTAAAPRSITCPACFSSGPTLVQRQSGCCAYLACFGLCWVCCPLFWLPFCLDCDKDVVHRCRACGTEVARIRPCGT